MTPYYRPLVQLDPVRPDDAYRLAGGWGWFAHVEVLQRGLAPKVIRASETPSDWLARLTASRSSTNGLAFDAPKVMGILNVTPDSFSDGGAYLGMADAVQHANSMVSGGAHILDIGGESTRPGAVTVAPAEEIARTAPVIEALRASGVSGPISIDTRKAAVARAALDAGATLVNDVSGFTYDADLAALCAERAAPVCVMHAQGDPATMQQNPHYDDVLLDVYDFLASRVDALESLGVSRHNVIVDPGIGFGKTQAHNLALLQRISLFHGLGVPVLLGASRKRFIGTISGAEQADQRMPGSVAVALAALAQGVQIVRVHDVTQTHQAIALWQAVRDGEH